MLVELIDVEVADFMHARPRQPQNEWEHPQASSWRGAGERLEKLASRERGWREAGEQGERLEGFSLSHARPYLSALLLRHSRPHKQNGTGGRECHTLSAREGGAPSSNKHQEKQQQQKQQQRQSRQ